MKFTLTQNQTTAALLGNPIAEAPRLPTSTKELVPAYEAFITDLGQQLNKINAMHQKHVQAVMKALPTEFAGVSSVLDGMASERAELEAKLAKTGVTFSDELAELKATTRAQNAIYGRHMSAADIAESGDAELMEAARRIYDEISEPESEKAMTAAIRELQAPGCYARLQALRELERELRATIHQSMSGVIGQLVRNLEPGLRHSANPAAAYQLEDVQ